MMAGSLSSWVDRLGRRVSGVGKHIRIYRNFPLSIAANLGAAPTSGDHELRLRNGLRFVMDASYLPATTNAIKDVIVDDTYGLHRLDPAAPLVVVDIGAHVGSFSLAAAVRCPAAKIHAVEPSARNIAYLKRNIELNGLGERVSVRRAAVAGADGEIEMYTSRQSATRNSIHQDEFLKTRDGDKELVEAVTLASLFDRQQITTCDFLKMDCEGAEYEILFNASEETIRRIRRVGMEYHDGVNGGTGDDVEQFFVQHGFTVHREPVPDCPRLGMLLADRVGI